MKITKEHLDYVTRLGYKTRASYEANERGIDKAYLVGKCIEGHHLKSEIRKYLQLPKCKQCYHNSLSKTEQHLEKLQKLGYKVEAYTHQLASGHNKVSVQGLCPNNHNINVGLRRFILDPHCNKCTRTRRKNSKDYIELLKKLGYKVEISYRVNSSENQVRIVEGTCPAGHVFESVAKYVPNPRCKKCYLDKVQKENLEIALNEGYEVKILVRNPTGRNSRTYFVGKCPNEHLIDMKVVDFISGGRRCSPCKKNLIAKRIEEIIKESRYNAVLERVAIESKDRDSRLFVVGNCPSGHPVRMNANSFEKGARCKGCVKYGFSTERPAIFYVISGEKILTKQHGKTQTSNRKVGKILKYGVFHPASGRLSIHESHGFNPTPLFSLYHSDSKVVATLEKKVKLMVQERSVASCKEHGLSFDGASESFYETDLDAPALIKNVNKIVKELELNYETSFKKISPQDALVIGGRSKSLVTKEKIDTILATMESGLSSTTTSKEHTHG